MVRLKFFMIKGGLILLTLLLDLRYSVLKLGMMAAMLLSGKKNGLETTVVLSEQEFSSLQSLDPEGKKQICIYWRPRWRRACYGHGCFRYRRSPSEDNR